MVRSINPIVVEEKICDLCSKQNKLLQQFMGERNRTSISHSKLRTRYNKTDREIDRMLNVLRQVI